VYVGFSPVVARNRVLVYKILDRGAQTVVRGDARCASQVLDRGSQADARGIAQVLDRGAQAVARCAAR
jgi:2-keto-3-deoxy-L-rhamnonate aldolase RhmA